MTLSIFLFASGKQRRPPQKDGRFFSSKKELLVSAGGNASRCRGACAPRIRFVALVPESDVQLRALAVIS